MATVNLSRAHEMSFSEARKLAQQWVIEGEDKYGLTGNYVENVNNDVIEFSRKGLSGTLTVTESEFTLELTLGFLFSAYKKHIIAQINANMDEILGKT